MKNLKSSGFKMKSSPYKVDFGGSLRGSGVSYDSNRKTSLNLNPGIKVGPVEVNLKAGGSFSGNRENMNMTRSTGFGGKIDLSKRGKGFKGSVSGKSITTTNSSGSKTKTKSAKLSLGYGKSKSGAFGCGPSGCGRNRSTGKNYNISGFGEHNFSKKETTVGAKGQYGILSGSASYNLKTKKPNFRVGVTVPIGKLSFGRK